LLFHKEGELRAMEVGEQVALLSTPHSFPTIRLATVFTSVRFGKIVAC